MASTSEVANDAPQDVAGNQRASELPSSGHAPEIRGPQPRGKLVRLTWPENNELTAVRSEILVTKVHVKGKPCVTRGQVTAAFREIAVDLHSDPHFQGLSVISPDTLADRWRYLFDDWKRDNKKRVQETGTGNELLTDYDKKMCDLMKLEASVLKEQADVRAAYQARNEEMEEAERIVLEHAEGVASGRTKPRSGRASPAPGDRPLQGGRQLTSLTWQAGNTRAKSQETAT